MDLGQGTSMVKLFGLTFGALLVCAHMADVQGDAYLRPLSMFRDYEPAWIGYAMLGLLAAIGLETIRTAWRAEAAHHVAVYLFATALVVAIAATPSYDEIHIMCSLVAMIMLFAYYAAVLYRNDCWFWLLMHLLTPSVLMLASRLESYGIWQKGMILYFLAAAVAHQNFLAQWAPKPRRATRKRVRIQVGRKHAA
jgi:hypothetical protein